MQEATMADQRIDSVLARKLNAFIPLSPGELKHLAALQSNQLKVRRGGQLTREGQTGHKGFIVQSGWACSFKILPDGGRQIISFPIAGDCCGLRSVLLRTADHSFSVLTDAVVSAVEGPQLMKCITEAPRLGTALLWALSRDEAMIVEHLVSIGRGNALERTAHFFMELAERLSLIGMATETKFECPLSQFVLADALGLTAIHMNRTLRQLRERQLLTLRKKVVTIHDLDRLRKLAGFQGGYLNSRTETAQL